MKKIILISIFTLFSTIVLSQENKTKCETALQKLKPSCNFIGDGMNKMKSFSKKNKTIDQTFNNIIKKK
tara:strand:+ start:257 stop:463 length:207 start_codon:yes stop_codon:yes gene_type:complete